MLSIIKELQESAIEAESCKGRVRSLAELYLRRPIRLQRSRPVVYILFDVPNSVVDHDTFQFV